MFSKVFFFSFFVLRAVCVLEGRCFQMFFRSFFLSGLFFFSSFMFLKGCFLWLFLRVVVFLVGLFFFKKKKFL